MTVEHLMTVLFAPDRVSRANDQQQIVDLLKAILIRLDEIKSLLDRPGVLKGNSPLDAEDIYAMTKRDRRLS
jgi:hypothetical protein